MSHRCQLERSVTWPPLIHLTTQNLKWKAGPMSAPAKPDLDPYQSFLKALDSNPDSHFLAPIKMYEYEDWASDSNDEGEEIEWDAGITDFALFDSDRRRARENDQPLPSRWNDMLENQSSALQRARDRSRTTHKQL